MHKLLNVSTYVHLEVLSMLICVSVRGSLKFYYTPSREPTVLVIKLYFRIIGLCCLQNH